MMGAPSGIWSDPANFEDVKRLWEEGKSASEITKFLVRKTRVGTTRGAVIGKLARAGLIGVRAQRTKETRKLAGTANGMQTRIYRSAEKPAAPRPNNLTAANMARRLAAVDQPMPILRTGEDITSLGIPFISRRDNQCAWPLGTDDTASMRCCGSATREGKPYCAGHCEIAYQPSQQMSGSTVRKYAAIGRVTLKSDDGEPVPLDIAA